MLHSSNLWFLAWCWKDHWPLVMATVESMIVDEGKTRPYVVSIRCIHFVLMMLRTSFTCQFDNTFAASARFQRHIDKLLYISRCKLMPVSTLPTELNLLSLGMDRENDGGIGTTWLIVTGKVNKSRRANIWPWFALQQLCNSVVVTFKVDLITWIYITWR